MNFIMHPKLNSVTMTLCTSELYVHAGWPLFKLLG